MRIKVLKAGRPSFWYAKHLGEMFEVVEERNDRYAGLTMVERPGGRGLGSVDREDYEIVSSHPEPAEPVSVEPKCECLSWARKTEWMRLPHHPRCPAADPADEKIRQAELILEGVPIRKLVPLMTRWQQTQALHDEVNRPPTEDNAKSGLRYVNTKTGQLAELENPDNLTNVEAWIQDNPVKALEEGK